VLTPSGILSAIIVLGILVFVHELGHFLLAKKLGVGVLTFSLGFGTKLIGRKIGETQYQVAAVPLGGFVKLIGENLEEEVKEEDRPRSFSNQPIWKRALIVGAGPLFNLLFAAVLFTGINFFGIPYLASTVGKVSPGLPAEGAGLKSGDTVLSIDGQEVSRWDDLSKIIRDSKGKELTIKARRAEETLEVKVTPEASKVKNLFGEEVSVFMIGISPSEEVLVEKVSPVVAFTQGLVQTWQGIELTVVSIVKLIQRVIPAKTVGGPILIAQVVGEQAKRGFASLIPLMAILSINLGIINIFPIPILDGGHFLFLGLEAVLRKPISIKKMERAQQVGLILIVLLMIFAFYNDILRLIDPGRMKF
jgi:regulator of sigma E protease